MGKKLFEVTTPQGLVHMWVAVCVVLRAACEQLPMLVGWSTIADRLCRTLFFWVSAARFPLSELETVWENQGTPAHSDASPERPVRIANVNPALTNIGTIKSPVQWCIEGKAGVRL